MWGVRKETCLTLEQRVAENEGGRQFRRRAPSADSIRARKPSSYRVRLKFDTLWVCSRSFSIQEHWDAIRRFPKEVRIRLGRGLFRMQLGEQLGMPNSRPMPAVAQGISELRVKGEDGIFRVFY